MVGTNTLASPPPRFLIFGLNGGVDAIELVLKSQLNAYALLFR